MDPAFDFFCSIASVDPPKVPFPSGDPTEFNKSSRTEGLGDSALQLVGTCVFQVNRISISDNCKKKYWKIQAIWTAKFYKKKKKAQSLENLEKKSPNVSFPATVMSSGWSGRSMSAMWTLSTTAWREPTVEGCTCTRQKRASKQFLSSSTRCQKVMALPIPSTNRRTVSGFTSLDLQAMSQSCLVEWCRMASPPKNEYKKVKSAEMVQNCLRKNLEQGFFWGSVRSRVQDRLLY